MEEAGRSGSFTGSGSNANGVWHAARAVTGDETCGGDGNSGRGLEIRGGEHPARELQRLAGAAPVGALSFRV